MSIASRLEAIGIVVVAAASVRGYIRVGTGMWILSRGRIWSSGVAVHCCILTIRFLSLLLISLIVVCILVGHVIVPRVPLRIRPWRPICSHRVRTTIGI
jgi:hypothetical protein